MKYYHIVKRIIHAISNRLFFIFQLLNWHKSVDKARLNKYITGSSSKGTLFILATGPSLNRTDLSLLEGFDVMTMNRGFLLQDRVKLRYLVCIDGKSHLEQFTEEYDKIEGIDVFYNWNYRHLFTSTKNKYYVLTGYTKRFVHRDNLIFGDGNSVTYTCVQLAFLLGYDQVVLLGKDHSYVAKGIPGQLNTVSGQLNHFDKSYYFNNQVFATPNYKSEEEAYSHAKLFYHRNKRKIYDSTVDGNLNIFEKKKLENIIAEL